MQDIQVFSFEESEVRTVTVDGDPWFIAKDVSEILGYRMASDMTRRLDDDEKGTQPVRTPGGFQELTVISESGLYNAILGSNKPEAKAFKKWVTSEVIPAIRKTGQYKAPGFNTPQTFAEALRLAADQAEQLAIAAPKVEAYESLMKTEHAMSITAAAKHFGLHPKLSVPYLREHGYLTTRDLPTQRAIDANVLTLKQTENKEQGRTYSQAVVLTNQLDNFRRLIVNKVKYELAKANTEILSSTPDMFGGKQ